MDFLSASLLPFIVARFALNSCHFEPSHSSSFAMRAPFCLSETAAHPPYCQKLHQHSSPVVPKRCYSVDLFLIFKIGGGEPTQHSGWAMWRGGGSPSDTGWAM